ncbi:MAG: DUF1318 domain-containing protein [Candidatus Brocadiia bacterium]
MAGRWRTALCLTVLLAVAGCGGLVGTRIRVEGSLPTLEQQVLGAWERTGQEVLLLAGVRSVDPITGRPQSPPPMTESEKQALEARRRMEFNRDDVARFRQAGYVGEGREGVLVPFEEQMEQLRADDQRLHDLVFAVTDEENQDRLTVMRRIVRTNPDLRGEEGLASVRQILAARYRQEAEPGAMIQTPDGRWIVKGEGGA